MNNLIWSTLLVLCACAGTTEHDKPGAFISDEEENINIRLDKGSRAIDFEKYRSDSTLFSLESLRGKYVLLEFWGSWCAPCRRSHSELNKLYEVYRSRGFEIVGIAQEGGKIERARQKWLDAIREDGTEWIQVLNDEGIGETDVVDLYGVIAFPTKFMIDPNGMIIYKTMGSSTDSLAMMLDSILRVP